jgi:hypothetical protein
MPFEAFEGSVTVFTFLIFLELEILFVKKISKKSKTAKRLRTTSYVRRERRRGTRGKETTRSKQKKRDPSRFALRERTMRLCGVRANA